jgi:hypothetical protein
MHLDLGGKIKRFRHVPMPLGGKDAHVRSALCPAKARHSSGPDSRVTQAHLGVMKRAVGAPVTGFARTGQHCWQPSVHERH